MPTLITLFFPSILKILILTQFFYIIAILIYINFLSLEKSYYPYYSSELSNISKQLKKGRELGLSAFLLITIYGILIIKIGKIVLPHFINLGESSRTYTWIVILLSLINPLLEEIYWRLFLLKVILVSYRPSKIPTRSSTSLMYAISSSTSPSLALSLDFGKLYPLSLPSTALGGAWNT